MGQGQGGMGQGGNGPGGNPEWEDLKVNVQGQGGMGQGGKGQGYQDMGGPPPYAPTGEGME